MEYTHLRNINITEKGGNLQKNGLFFVVLKVTMPTRGAQVQWGIKGEQQNLRDMESL